MFLTLLFAVYTVAGMPRHGESTAVSLELWQVVNLIGAPALALMFLPPVVEDLRNWFRSLRNESDS
jgi:hypothetical protein